jgi:hypothetical protein
MRSKWTVAAMLVVFPLSTAAAEDRKPARDPNKIVCKSKPRTNSRFQDKICRTRAEWEEIAEASKRDAKELMDAPVINTDRTD